MTKRGQNSSLFQTKLFNKNFFISNVSEMTIHLRDGYLKFPDKTILPCISGAYLTGGVEQRPDKALQMFMKLNKTFIAINTVYQSGVLNHTSNTCVTCCGSLTEFCVLLGSSFFHD